MHGEWACELWRATWPCPHLAARMHGTPSDQEATRDPGEPPGPCARSPRSDVGCEEPQRLEV
eukprot:4605038-Pyramimonas_sp.AAC.1